MKSILFQIFLLITFNLSLIFDPSKENPSQDNCEIHFMKVEEALEIGLRINSDSLIRVANSADFYIFKLSGNSLSGIKISSCINLNDSTLSLSPKDSIINFEYKSILTKDSALISLGGIPNELGFWLEKKGSYSHTHVELIIFKFKGSLICGYTLDGCDVTLGLRNILERLMHSEDVAKFTLLLGVVFRTKK